MFISDIIVKHSCKQQFLLRMPFLWIFFLFLWVFPPLPPAEAVPCAIYAFLCHAVSSTFEELVPYAISLGGDADTIASMAGAIGGAYWGFDAMPRDWTDSCEDITRCRDLGDSLYDVVFSST
jgi:hypothetical protein